MEGVGLTASQRLAHGGVLSAFGLQSSTGPDWAI